MQIDWAPEHSDALREYFAKRMSYSEIAQAINAKFGTAYSRNAALGRAKRMGLAGPEPAGKPNHWPKLPSKAPRCKRREHHWPQFMRPMPDFERTETAPLRCVEIVPRHLSLVELDPVIAATPMAAMSKAKPLLSAATAAVRVRATAGRIFI